MKTQRKTKDLTPGEMHMYTYLPASSFFVPAFQTTPKIHVGSLYFSPNSYLTFGSHISWQGLGIHWIENRSIYSIFWRASNSAPQEQRGCVAEGKPAAVRSSPTELPRRMEKNLLGLCSITHLAEIKMVCFRWAPRNPSTWINKSWPKPKRSTVGVGEEGVQADPQYLVIKP